MNKLNTALILAVTLVAPLAHADEFPNITLYPYPAHQVGDTSQVRAGFVVVGETKWASLTTGGGFTLTCGAQVVTAENAAHSGFIAGYNAAIAHVPETQPADYDVGGFSSLASGRCRDCTFQYRGRVVEGVATINATSRGAGFVFTVNGVDITKSDTSTFTVCKPSAARPVPRGGCTP